MRPRLGGAERSQRQPQRRGAPSCFNAAAPGGRGEGERGEDPDLVLAASMRPRLGGAERVKPDSGPVSGVLLQCGRAWGARRGGAGPSRSGRPRRFNAAAPGGRGEDRLLLVVPTHHLASMRPRLGGAERPRRPRSLPERCWLQCGRAWGARRGRFALRGQRLRLASMRPRLGGAERLPNYVELERRMLASMRPRLGGAERRLAGRVHLGVGSGFNAAAPGGRGEEVVMGSFGAWLRGFNAAAPGGRGEVQTAGGGAPSDRGFNAAAPGGRGEARPRIPGTMTRRRFNAAAPGGRGEAAWCGDGPARRSRFNAAAPGGRGEAPATPRGPARRRGLQCGRAWGARRGRRVAGRVSTGFWLQCGRAWGARRGNRARRRQDRLGRFNAAAPGGRGEAQGSPPYQSAVHASMRPRLGGAERQSPQQRLVS